MYRYKTPGGKGLISARSSGDHGERFDRICDQRTNNWINLSAAFLLSAPRGPRVIQPIINVSRSSLFLFIVWARESKSDAALQSSSSPVSRELPKEDIAGGGSGNFQQRQFRFAQRHVNVSATRRSSISRFRLDLIARGFVTQYLPLNSSNCVAQRVGRRTTRSSRWGANKLGRLFDIFYRFSGSSCSSCFARFRSSWFSRRGSLS